MGISLDKIYDQIDKAIIYLSLDYPMDKWKIQKGVFYFLWLSNPRNKKKDNDFLDMVKIIQFRPYIQGPYSEVVGGEVETLIRDGFLDAIDPNSKDFPVKTTAKGKAEFIKDIDKEEEFCLSEIKNIFDVLDSYEVLFFIYFNPYIPEDIQDYFISKSEIIDGLKIKKDKYIKRLKECGIIDDITATKMLKKANK
jgi:uncharacterized protein YwgA